MEEKFKRSLYCMEIVIYWIGAILVVVAPLFKRISTWIAILILGLFILTLQAIDQELYNLIALNVASILIYTHRYLKETQKEKITL